MTVSGGVFVFPPPTPIVVGGSGVGGIGARNGSPFVFPGDPITTNITFPSGITLTAGNPDFTVVDYVATYPLTFSVDLTVSPGTYSVPYTWVDTANSATASRNFSIQVYSAPITTGAPLLRDRIDTMYLSSSTSGDVTFNYQIPTGPFGSIARFKGTIQALSGSVGGGNYVGAVFDVDFFVVTPSSGLSSPPISLNGFPNGQGLLYNGVITGTAPTLSVTPNNPSLLVFDIANSQINSVNTYWQIAIDVTLMESLE